MPANAHAQCEWTFGYYQALCPHVNLNSACAIAPVKHSWTENNKGNHSFLSSSTP